MSVVTAKVSLKYNKRKLIILALFLNALALLFQGPSRILNFPDSYYLIAMSQGIIGVFGPFLIVPNLPEMMESVASSFSKD